MLAQGRMSIGALAVFSALQSTVSSGLSMALEAVPLMKSTRLSLIHILLARVIIAPLEFPVGILITMIGVPFFIFVSRRQRGTFS